MSPPATDHEVDAASDILLVFPPHCETAVQGPHLAIPQLAGFLTENGVAVETHDLNIAFFRFVTSHEVLEREFPRLIERREDLASRDELDNAELDELFGLGKIETILSRAARERLEDEAFWQAIRLLSDRVHAAPVELAAMLDRGGASELVRTFFDRLDLEMMRRGASVVGISVAFHLQLGAAVELARRFREQCPDCTIVLGGSQISLMTDPQRQEIASLPFVDAVVLHEGEIPLLEICQRSRRGDPVDFSSVPNTYADTTDGPTRSGWHTPPPMDELPVPLFKPSELSSYLHPVQLPVYVSKGCYWGRCKFCDYTKLYTPGQAKGPSWATFRKADRICDDMQALRDRHGVSDFYLVSEAIPPNYYKALSQSILRRRMLVRLSSYCRVERSYQPHYFELLASAGVRSLTFGVEATNDRVLELIAKGNRVQDVQRTIQLAGSAGIAVVFNLIPDYPTTTWHDVREGIRFIRENVDYIAHLNPQFFDLSGNSQILDEEDEHGLIARPDDAIVTNHGVHSVPFQRTSGLDDAELARVRMLFHRLPGELELYRRTKGVLPIISAPTFEWSRASFVLSKDLEVTTSPFDPSSATLQEDGSVSFARRDDPVHVVSSATTLRRISVPPLGMAILETSEARGVFTVQHVLDTIQQSWSVRDMSICESFIVRCLDSFVRNGFVNHVYHPMLPFPNLDGSVLWDEA
jgi:radical SAM superfamily enzyme YgiQ (UPF0313 family)